MHGHLGSTGHVPDRVHVLALLPHLEALLPTVVFLICSRVTFCIDVLQTNTLKPTVSLLLAQKAAEAPVAACGPIISFVLEAATVLIKNLILRYVLRFMLVLIVLVNSVNFLSLNVKLTKLLHIIDHLVTDFDTFSGLIKCVLVSMDLGQDGAVLQLELADDEDFSHSI
jgi:hypothetical protein